MRTLRSCLALLTLVLLAAMALSAQPRIFSKTGKARVGGRDVLVHVTVGVPPGVDRERAANAAIRAQGGIPLGVSEFSTTGLVWDQFFDSDTSNDSVAQSLNPANDPTGDGQGILQNSQTTWGDAAVTGSSFQISFGGTTGRCPSLVRECRGPQKFDGKNDVAWLAINDPYTLAVTWSSSSVDEADMAVNTRQNWNFYDAETVILHENGHVAGLGHSTVAGAVMAAVYDGVRRQLSADDIAGLVSLYPAAIDPPLDLCGNGSLDPGEQCDGNDLGGASCVDLGFAGGALACDACTFDTSGCTLNDPGCTLGGLGDQCDLNSECCSGKCRGKRGAKLCR